MLFILFSGDELKFDKPHRRLNILTGEWTLVSPQRTKRPWSGEKTNAVQTEREKYDAKCYLCPGNVRANGEKNPDYKTTFVFENDFSALLKSEENNFIKNDDLFKARSVSGVCKVICFSPRHDLTLAEMELSEIENVISVWISEQKELGEKYSWVQIFENRGEIMGSSNPHPHGQIWASDFIPNEVVKETENQKKYFETHESPALIDYLLKEKESGERIIYENENWVVLTPFWAVWPFETMALPKRHILRLTDISVEEQKDLADALKTLLVKYDNIFHVSFPYTMGWHGAPTDGNTYEYWQLHAHFYPPLLRSAEIKKFMVGYEMLAEAQRDITPEQAAEKIRSMPDIHFKTKTE